MQSREKGSICPSRHRVVNSRKPSKHVVLQNLQESSGLTTAQLKVKRKPIDRHTMDRAVSQRLGERINRCLAAVPKDPFRVHDLGKPGKPAEEATGTHVGQPPWRQVTIEAKAKPRPMPERVENWMENFHRKPTGERIQWRSPLYDAGRPPAEPRPVDQVEQLIDVAGQDFVDWLNTLGLERSSITSQIVRQLFSSETGDELSRALTVAPKELRAVPGQVAHEWALPELSLEHRIARATERNRAMVYDAAKRVPFLRAHQKMPNKRQRSAATGDGGGHTDETGDDVPERVDVPEDLISFRRLFKDIWHLRSVKYLIDYLERRPELERPAFLVEKGLFERKESIGIGVPFYRKVLTQEALADSIRK
ncbi:uncharacterized protein LOC126576912 [Anopheles aquasalis]|uniref:uncharacterized protein LOC126576912 n=1 Tax=Anopheles aquasalis TaxID=42839 RepID=UPI00215B1E98|nr:uncharacterized protein LOC126576912 [Anopheles aquasalis]